MHAFDLVRLGGGELRIRRARPGERMPTLDGVDRTLADDMLVIADAAEPQAIAGVMGGAGSEVWSGTRAIAFESAYFEPTPCAGRAAGRASRRRRRRGSSAAPTSARRRWRSSARSRWSPPSARARRVPGRIDCYPAPRAAHVWRCAGTRVARVLGRAPSRTPTSSASSPASASRTEPTADGWLATVPTARVDVSREEDLDRGGRPAPRLRPPADDVAPADRAAAGPAARPGAASRRCGALLAGAGFSEAQTYAFIEARAAAPFAGRPHRPSPSPTRCRRSSPSCARRWCRASSTPSRSTGTAARVMCGCSKSALCSRQTSGEARRARPHLDRRGGRPEHWSGGVAAVDFFDLKGAVAALCRRARAAMPGFEPVDARRARARPLGRRDCRRAGTSARLGQLAAGARRRPAASRRRKRSTWRSSISTLVERLAPAGRPASVAARRASRRSSAIWRCSSANGVPAGGDSRDDSCRRARHRWSPSGSSIGTRGRRSRTGTSASRST